MRVPSRQNVGYVAVLAACFLLAVIAGWTPLGSQIDNNFYDFMFRFRPPVLSASHSVILAIDERTLMEMGGMRQIRSIVAAGLEALQETRPAAVVVDLILADEGEPDELPVHTVKCDAFHIGRCEITNQQYCDYQ